MSAPTTDHARRAAQIAAWTRVWALLLKPPSEASESAVAEGQPSTQSPLSAERPDDEPHVQAINLARGRSRRPPGRRA